MAHLPMTSAARRVQRQSKMYCTLQIIHALPLASAIDCSKFYTPQAFAKDDGVVWRISMI